MVRCEIKVSKEDYEKAKQMTIDELELRYTTVSERLGYGVYGIGLGKPYFENGKEVYFIYYNRGSTCD